MAKEKISKPRCLIVDDDPKWLNALACLMKEMECDVELALNAHTAIRILEKLSFDILLLDWDLRSTMGSLCRSKIGADVLNEMPKEDRARVKVVIVTGALDDPEFLKAFDQELNDIHEEIDGYQPFLKIMKKRFAQDLNSGLGTLRERFEEIGLTKQISESTVKTAAGRKKRPRPPFRLDFEEPQFYDLDGVNYPLPRKCHKVLMEMLVKKKSGGGIPAYRKKILSDEEVCEIYGQDSDDSSLSAAQFARALRKYLKRHYGWEEKNSLIRRISRYGYAIGKHWDDTRPIFNTSEVSIDRNTSIEDAEKKFHHF